MGNAGCYNHSLMEYVQSVKVLTNEGNIINISKSEIDYGYRYTSLKGNIILSVTFKLEKGDPLETLKLIKENKSTEIVNELLIRMLDIPVRRKSIFKRERISNER